MEMIRKVIVTGNAIGITIDSKIVEVQGIKPGDLVKVSIEKITNEP